MKQASALILVFPFLVFSIAARGADDRPLTEHLTSMEWLLGDWVGEYTLEYDWGDFKAGDHLITHASRRWGLDKSIIVEDYISVVDGTRYPETHEVMRWDAVGQRLVHDIVGPGGAGDGQWTTVGEKAALRWNFVYQGVKVDGTSYLEKKGDDSYTWQVREVTVDGEKKPDLPVVTFHRKKGEAAGGLWEKWRAAVAGQWLGKGTFGRDQPAQGLTKGDRFTFPLTWTAALDGSVLLGKGEFNVPEKNVHVELQEQCFWDPQTRQIRLSAVWSNGMVEEISLQRMRGTAFLGTFTTKSPGCAAERGGISLDCPDADTCILTLLDGPRKGHVLNTFKRVK